MSTRRVPLSSHPNGTNSPLRSHNTASASVLNKYRQQKRAYASVQREEPYGQPPPAKKQLLNNGSKEPVRSPPAVRQVKVVRPNLNRVFKDDKPSQVSASKVAQQEDEAARMRRWKEATRQNFPDYVFYFESVPDEKRAKVVKQITQLGGREEKFFSKDITHVITTRSVPTDRSARAHPDNASVSGHTQRVQTDMPKTIDPSLLSRDPNGTKDIRRRLLESGRKKVPVAEDSALGRPAAARTTDILVRAQEMNKKIWQYTKLQRVLQVMFDPDPLGVNGTASKAEDSNLAQLLSKERTNGPSDRDPTVSTKELIYFKGPYIYIYDIEEKQKPIMVREYAKVADKKDGDWPQFRASTDGRCPFVEETPAERKREIEKEKLAREKARQEQRERRLAEKAAEEAAERKPPPTPLGKPISAKRTLSEMESSNSLAGPTRVPEVFDLAKAANPPSLDFNAFTSRARSARLFGGEPVASGMQPSNVTSAIRSQMISSATGVLGAKAGTSKELHGLQRKVLQKSNVTSANPTSQDMSSRRLADMSLDTSTYQRSASLGLGSRKLGQIEEDRVKDHKRTMSVPFAAPAKPKKRDLKPGYCENCQDKFADFEEHILMKKHRKFAEDNRNWSKLDSLLGQLQRVRKYEPILDDEGSEDYPEY
ncbi:Cdc7p-Dbf4p kinase complex regulatory subunit [Gnomoniopsis sp. IMI 355080]|nr:Cdc7p-Dbf4p kinase complex regulatory subunit [Gnomoniopsis sp. IMI 355080]